MRCMTLTARLNSLRDIDRRRRENQRILAACRCASALATQTTKRCLRVVDKINDAIKDKRGAAAVEFAIIAGPFLMTLVGIFAMSAYMLTNTVLLNATMAAGRAFATNNLDPSGVAAAVCAGVSPLPCSNVTVAIVDTSQGNSPVDPALSIGEYAPGDVYLMSVTLPFATLVPVPLLPSTVVATYVFVGGGI